MKPRYWILLVLTLVIAYFLPMTIRIKTAQDLRREALAAAGGDLPYQLVISDFTGVVGDIIYTNDYSFSPASNGNKNLTNIHIRWGVMWAENQWDFILEPLDLENVKVIVNTGGAIK